MDDGRQSQYGILEAGQINALSDGVIAVVITLLVLGIDVPQGHQFSTEGFLSFLQKIEYQLVVYAIAFALVGTYWLQHAAMFHYFRQGSRRLVWLNLAFLFVVTLVPFVTKIIGTYRYQPLVIIPFAVVNVACGLSLAVMWWYANRVEPVVWPRIDPTVVRSMSTRILIGPAVCLVAVAVSFVNVRLGHAVFLTIPLVYLSHRSVDTHWPEIVEDADQAT